jgi:hypothetical protein
VPGVFAGVRIRGDEFPAEVIGRKNEFGRVHTAIVVALPVSRCERGIPISSRDKTKQCFRVSQCLSRIGV